MCRIHGFYSLPEIVRNFLILYLCLDIPAQSFAQESLSTQVLMLFIDTKYPELTVGFFEAQGAF